MLLVNRGLNRLAGEKTALLQGNGCARAVSAATDKYATRAAIMKKR
jgi:hypothetical protein